MKSTGKIKVGIIGAGRIGKLHAEHLAFAIRNADPVAIADIIKNVAEETAKHLNIPFATNDYRKILDDRAIAAVVICTSTETHSQLIQEAAAADKHIFCEKPIDLTLEKIHLALKAVEKANVKFQVGFNRRFDPNFSGIKELIAAGKIGQPHLLRITSRDPAPPPLEYIRSSGGIFLDMTIHDFDMARYLIGSEVAEVYAVGNVLIDARFRNADDVDTAATTLKFENGTIGIIDNSRKAVYGYDQRIEVFGSLGMVQASNKTPDNLTIMTAESVHSSKPLYFFLERYKESFIAEMQAFIDAIINDTVPPITGKDGLMPVKIALAAKTSLAENRPVKLNEIKF
jgi:myo-inositol 2-dehydrogenase/D-chiro-inositol 1-dehydrogenase